MMIPSEIRVGNAIDYRGRIALITGLSSGGLCTISIFKHSVDALDIDLNECRPIIITHDLLIKSEYQYANENGQKFYWHPDLPYFQLRKDEEHEWLMWHSESSNEILITQEDFTAFHTLQNIFFAIAGKELTINL
jgi:hypothetical protein